MNWIRRLLGTRPELAPDQSRRLEAWRDLPVPPMHVPLLESRYVVVDVESSGLNIAKDRLIAIGAVAVVNGKIQLADSLDIVLQQELVSDKDNILIHGIGGTAQREGVPPVEALLAFLEYLGKDPLIAFHVAFDESMISRALKTFLGLKFQHVWADLAYVSPALYPDLARRYRSLDHWMGHFGISNYARHSALADALATAELLLALGSRMTEKSVLNMRGLRAAEKTQQMNNWAM